MKFRRAFRLRAVSSLAWTIALGATAPLLATPSPAGLFGETYYAYIVIGVFPEVPLDRVSIEVLVDHHYPGSPDPAYENNFKPIMPDVISNYRGEGVFEIDFPDYDGGYRQSQAVLGCQYFTHEPNYPATFQFSLVEAEALDNRDETENTALCYSQYDDDNPKRTLDSHYFCGDATEDETVTATDALAVLKVSIGITTCMRARCDADGDSSIDVVDVLRVLRFVVGVDVPLLCSACSP